jgi:hypothetical protein
MPVNLDRDPSGDFEDHYPEMPRERQLRLLEIIQEDEQDIEKCRATFKRMYGYAPLF